MSAVKRAFKDRRAPKMRKVVFVEMQNEGKAKDKQRKGVK